MWEEANETPALGIADRRSDHRRDLRTVGAPTASVTHTWVAEWIGDQPATITIASTSMKSRMAAYHSVFPDIAIKESSTPAERNHRGRAPGKNQNCDCQSGPRGVCDEDREPHDRHDPAPVRLWPRRSCGIDVIARVAQTPHAGSFSSPSVGLSRGRRYQCVGLADQSNTCAIAALLALHGRLPEPHAHLLRK
jgi:hypothetical protein